MGGKLGKRGVQVHTGLSRGDMRRWGILGHCFNVWLYLSEECKYVDCTFRIVVLGDSK